MVRKRNRKPLDMLDYQWVSCSEKEYGYAGAHRHLIHLDERKKPHWQTTVCGATASLSGIWRKNGSKDKCTPCEKISKGLEPY